MIREPEDSVVPRSNVLVLGLPAFISNEAHRCLCVLDVVCFCVRACLCVCGFSGSCLLCPAQNRLITGRSVSARAPLVSLLSLLPRINSSRRVPESVTRSVTISLGMFSIPHTRKGKNLPRDHVPRNMFVCVYWPSRVSLCVPLYIHTRGGGFAYDFFFFLLHAKLFLLEH